MYIPQTKVYDKYVYGWPNVINQMVSNSIQLTVFRVLFEHWADFCTFKSNTATEQILPTIERKRRRAKLRERQRQKELEEQQERVCS